MTSPERKGFSEKDVERFLSRIKKTDTCWLWMGARSKGYGHFGFHGKTVGAHRFSFQYFKSDPGELFVCHHCDNPPCVNPDHLFLGTVSDNAIDMVRKGRRTYPPFLGEKHGRHLLTIQQVRQIIDDHANRKFRLGEMADQYGVSVGCISKIVYRINWVEALSKGESE